VALTVGNGVPAAGARPAVGEAAEVVLRDEVMVRGVPQQVEEEETALTACSPGSGLGGGAAAPVAR
jgi:hypothetical protein